MLGVVLIITAAFIHSCISQPCTEYTSIDDAHRSTSYRSDGSIVLCDEGRIVEGNWYRFTNYVGGKMPEVCVGVNSCGTVYPVWMNGAHPTATNPGPINVRACVNGGSCCDITLDIQVQWCMDENNVEYFVYALAEVPACEIAYCAGSLTACDYGKVWNRRQRQCVDEVPEISGSIILSDPVVPNNPETEKFHFECHVPYQTLTDDGARFLVTWLFDGTKVDGVPDFVISELSRVATLSEDYLKGNLGKELSCSVKAFWEDINIYGETYYSNSYWMGIQATNNITVVEGQGAQGTTLYSTLPITCGCCPNLNACFHSFGISTQSLKQLSCTVTFSVQVPQPTVMVEALYTPGHGQLPAFDIEFTPVNDIFADPIWEGYQIEPVHVTVIDQMVWKRCEIYGDPYFYTFDGFGYEMRETGRFFIVKTDTEFEIQGIFKQCDSGVMASCLCAIAVRSKNSVLGIDACDGNPYDAKTFQKFINTDVSYADFVYSGGDWFEMIFEQPQTYIYVHINDYNIMEVFIESFITRGESSGLCGTADDNWDNEFEPFDNFDYNVVYDEYRIPDGYSFFDGVYECDSYVIIDTPCECDRQTKEIKCGNSGSNVEYNFGDVCNFEKRKKRSANQRLHERSVDSDYTDNSADFFSVMDYEFDNTPSNFPDVDWPTPSGITEADAESWCLTVLKMSPAFEICAPQIDLDQIMQGCKSDIKLTDNPDSAYTKISTMEKNCIFSAESSQVYGAEGETEIIDLIQTIKDKTCPNLCSSRGSCVSGQCECNQGYFGSDCSLEFGVAPSVVTVENDGLCDLQERPCVLVKIQAAPLSEVNNLVCRIQHVLLNKEGKHKPYINAEVNLPGRMLNGRKLQCPLPVSPVSPAYTGGFQKTEHGFAVTVSLDGEIFSEPFLMVVFDSLCKSCDVDGLCFTKESTCVVDGQCNFGDDCTNSTEGTDTDLPVDETAMFLIDEESIQALEDNLQDLKETLAHEMNLHCINHPVECCQALGFKVNSVPDSGLFQWTDASMWIIVTGEKSDDQVVIVMAVSVPLHNAELLCGAESDLTTVEAYFDAHMITAVVLENKNSIDEDHGVEFLTLKTTTEGVEEAGANMALVGGIIGGLLGVAVIVIVIVVICKLKKKPKKAETTPSSSQYFTGSLPFPRENSWTSNRDITEPRTLQNEDVITAAPPQSTRLNKISVKSGATPHGYLEPIG